MEGVDKALTYDDIGNPLEYGDWDLVWEHGRQLKSMDDGSQTLSFKYNASGIRTEKTVGSVTTKYHLEGDKVTFESDGTDEIHYSYSSSGRLVSMNLNGTEYYYIRNAQGDITGLFDENGTIVVEYTYDSWGKLISTTGSLASSVGEKNPYRYRGYRYDTETGLYYLKSRYYNPEFCRMLNADALGGEVGKLLSHNVFAYSLNNPVNMSDPSGFRPILSASLAEETEEMKKASLETMATVSKSGSNNKGRTIKGVVNSGVIGYQVHSAFKDTRNLHTVNNGRAHEGMIRTWKPGSTDSYATPFRFTMKEVASSARTTFLITAAVSGVENFIDSGYQFNESFVTGTVADTIVYGTVGLMTTAAVAAVFVIAGVSAPAWALVTAGVVIGYTVNKVCGDGISGVSDDITDYLSSIF